jgi:hypothetical protein
VIRIALDERPLAWHTVQVRLDGEAHELRVRYHLLTPEDASERSAERVRMARTFQGADADAMFAALLDRLTIERVAGMRALIAERVVEWDLADLDGHPIAATPVAVQALLDHGAFLRPLYEGLVDASLGADSKNA